MYFVSQLLSCVTICVGFILFLCSETIFSELLQNSTRNNIIYVWCSTFYFVLCTCLILKTHLETYAYGRWLSSFFGFRIFPECSAPVQLYVELVVVPSGAIDVNTVRVVAVARAVEQPYEGPVESNADFHVVVLAFCFDVWNRNFTVRYR